MLNYSKGIRKIQAKQNLIWLNNIKGILTEFPPTPPPPSKLFQNNYNACKNDLCYTFMKYPFLPTVLPNRITIKPLIPFHPNSQRQINMALLESSNSNWTSLNSFCNCKSLWWNCIILKFSELAKYYELLQKMGAITEYSKFDKRCSVTHFVSFLLHYYCTF